MNQVITGNTAGADIAIFADPCAHQATIPYHNWRACKHAHRNQALNRISQPPTQIEACPIVDAVLGCTGLLATFLL